ncbi:MAG: hypothetical protein DRQ46_00255 [Gammaproteobacteria bacterium]|nr:MAG: hypothetical protein DRQ46_00255 [Gammaproteobacteria bacterium]
MLLDNTSFSGLVSALIIDADKDWQGFDLTNIGDSDVQNLTVYEKLIAGIAESSTVVNGEFDNGETGWTDASSAWTPISGPDNYVQTTTAFTALTQYGTTLTIGKWYKVDYKIEVISFMAPKLSVGGWDITWGAGVLSGFAEDVAYFQATAATGPKLEDFGGFGGTLNIYRFEVYELTEAEIAIQEIQSLRFGILQSVSNTSPIGNYALPMGYDCEASGNYSAAFGDRSIASGISSFAAGGYQIMPAQATVASGNFSVAMGYAARAQGHGSVGLGFGVNAVAHYSVSLGTNSEALQPAAVAIGDRASAQGYSSVAIGFDALAEANYATAIGPSQGFGDGPRAKGWASLAIGYNNEVSYGASYALAIGKSITNATLNSFAMGINQIDLFLTSGYVDIPQDNTKFRLGLGNDVSIVYTGTTWDFIVEKATAEIVFNNLGFDTDFRIESDTNANCFFLDAGTSRIGINKNAPAYPLDVVGDVSSSTLFRIGAAAGATGNFTTTDGKTVTVTGGIITNIV